MQHHAEASTLALAGRRWVVDPEFLSEVERRFLLLPFPTLPNSPVAPPGVEPWCVVPSEVLVPGTLLLLLLLLMEPEGGLGVWRGEARERWRAPPLAATLTLNHPVTAIDQLSTCWTRSGSQGRRHVWVWERITDENRLWEPVTSFFIYLLFYYVFIIIYICHTLTLVSALPPPSL